MAPATGATFLHADLDAFYASVEQLLDPSLRGRPVAVGGGVVLAASYEAKALGVTGGMAGWRAKQLCPDLVFAGGHFSDYQRLGDAVVDVLRDYTPQVERISIDEAFLDVAGSVHLFGSPAQIATDIRRRVSDEIGLAISVGVATTKHLAKVASQVAKPDGLVVVEPGQERVFLQPLPVGLIWGVGPATRARLAARGITTIGELAAVSPEVLTHLLGPAAGGKLHALARNLDPRRIVTDQKAKSVGAQSALGRRPATDNTLRSAFGFLADRVAARLRKAEKAGHTVTVRVRFRDLRAVTRSATYPIPVSTTRTLAELAIDLARSALADHPDEREITLVAISVSHLDDDLPMQLSLPLWSVPRRMEADRAVDAVRRRFGRDAVGYAATALDRERRVPDEFRALAERDP